MKRRVTLKLEALDNRIVPSGGGSKPGGVGDGVSSYIVPLGPGGETAHVLTVAIGDQGGLDNPPDGGRGGIGGEV